MSDDILDIETSEQDCSPRELVEIVHGTTAYRLTTATRDIVYQGKIYKATAATRGEEGPAGVGRATKETTLTLPLDHAFAKRWLQQSTPPKLATVTMRRMYLPSGLVEQFWEGEVQGMSWNDEGTEAVFNVVARFGKTLLRVIPTVTAGPTCPHPLYGKMCRISRTGNNPDGIPYLCTATVMYINGREVRIDLSTVPADYVDRADWTKGGDFEHVASGEIMTVQQQDDLNPGISTVTKLTLDAIVVGMKIGDQVKVYAGCDFTMAMCNRKFGNRHNFGGFNRMPRKNIFRPANTGLSETGEF